MKLIPVEKVNVEQIKEMDDILKLINSETALIKYSKMRCVGFKCDYVYYLMHNEKQYDTLMNIITLCR